MEQLKYNNRDSRARTVKAGSECREEDHTQVTSLRYRAGWFYKKSARRGGSEDTMYGLRKLLMELRRKGNAGVVGEMWWYKCSEGLRDEGAPKTMVWSCELERHEEGGVMVRIEKWEKSIRRPWAGCLDMLLGTVFSVRS